MTFLAASSEFNLVPPFVDTRSKKRNSFSARVPPFRRFLRQKDRPIFLGITNCRLSRLRHFYTFRRVCPFLVPFSVSNDGTQRRYELRTDHGTRSCFHPLELDRVRAISLRDAPTEFTADRTDFPLCNNETPAVVISIESCSYRTLRNSQ